MLQQSIIDSKMFLQSQALGATHQPS